MCQRVACREWTVSAWTMGIRALLLLMPRVGRIKRTPNIYERESNPGG